VADRMAWQTTLYLPENLTTDPGKCTNLTLNAEIAASGRKISYNIPLPELVSDGSATNAAPLRRARYHDITACLKSIAGKFEMNLKVSEWTVRNLVHDLHGPYHLQVEKTEQVPVVAGEETHLWYHSDVPVSFESQRQIINGREINVLNIEKMPGFENDSIIITANPALPLDYDLNESYFHIIAGNLKKKIQIWPFTIKPFLKVSPEYTEVEVREMIESGSNTLNIPLQFTTNLSQVRVNLTEGWDEPDAPVEFKTLSTCNSPSESEYIYTGDNAHEGIVRVDMNGFIKGNAFWSDNHSLKLQFTAFDKEGNRFGSPITAEINIIPKRFKYRIYFRPAGDDWANPHVYIYQSLALPYTLDKSKVDGPYKDRAGRPVGGFVFKNIGQNSEAGLQYSFTGRLTFRGWSTQGGPADNNPYEAALFNPQTTEGFYVFGSITPSSGPNAGKTGYGLKYIPPANRSQWLVNGADEATLRKHYDIDTDYMATHRGGLTYLCPLCQGEDTYNMKYPGIRMMMSEKYPGWWYVDLSEVATPGKALVMFHDGHAVEGPLQVPGPGQPGIPLFDYPDNEGWVYYTGNQKGAFTDERPSVAAKYQEDTYRIYFPKGNKGIRLELLNAAANGVQSDLLTATSPAALKGYDADFNYVEFKLSSKLAQRRLNAYLVYSNDAEGSGMLSLPDFKSEAGIRTYTFTADANSHPGKPESGDTDITKYRIYWQQSPDVKGFNMWFNTWVMNNYDNASKSYLNIPYISGSEVLSGITYDYYEFQLPANAAAGSSGWQMHLSSGIYSYQKDVTVADFAATAANPSLKCLYRDACYNALPYAPNVSGNNYRIYWPRYYNGNDISTAWFWSASNADGFWITPTGTENVNGNQYYYYDFTDAGNLHTSHGGVIPRTTPSWSSGMAPTGKNCNFERYSFHYDTAAGRNVAFVNNSFNGIGINGL
ncbi:MAG: hypothetical protein K2H35_00095, partial [Muribaculaceae bacterium]|nr:hypothetical protein [Muribaculaceae bacterium]